MQNTKLPMAVSISQNIVNILLSLLFVYGLHMKIEGVALGTLLAQWSGLVVAFIMLRWRYGDIWKGVKVRSAIKLKEMRRFFSVNSILFYRTVFLVAVNLYFIVAGAKGGAEILSVNSVLMQMFILYTYVMDGFAYAGEALGGKFWGAKDVRAFKSVVRHLFLWGALMTALFTAIYVFGGMPFLRLLTDNRHVVAASEGYVWWAYLIPVAGVAAFIWDGLYIGTTHIRGMLISSAIAAIAFFATAIYLMPYFGNQALWLAMIVFLAMRGIVQTYLALSFELRLSR
jgi:MATE family multidrug resistance protein